MKRLFTILASGLLFHVAQAQSPGVYTVGTLNGGTYAVAASTTNAPNNTFTVSEFDNVGIQVTLAASTTNTTAVVFKFSRSVDGTNYETTPSISLSVTPNGVTPVTVFANQLVPSSALLKLVAIENGNANGYVTNVAVKWRVKAPKRLDR